jgi:hypothetical protein
MEWEDGAFRDTMFTEEAGRKLYQSHLTDLEKYADVFGDAELIRLGTKLVDNGRCVCL